MKAALVCPIISPEQELLGVIEITKRETSGQYNIHDMNMVLMLSAWFGNIIHQREKRVLENLQFSTVTSLVDLSTKIKEIPDKDIIIYDVMDICLDKLNAKAGYYYAFIPSNAGIVAEVYEYDKILPAYQRRHRRLDDAQNTAAGYVANTHEKLNIRDVALDKRFNETDEFMSHFSLTSLLCQEVKKNGNPVGILQINNKAHNGVFMHQDENLYNIICSFLSFLLELKEMRKVSKFNILMNKFLRATVGHHLTPCSECQRGVTSVRNPLPWQVMSWNWQRGHIEFSTALCLMLSRVLTPASVTKHRLNILILTMNKIYHTLSEEQWMAVFYKFHMTFCILVRNQDNFRFTETLSVLICEIFSKLCYLLQNLVDKTNKSETVLKNRAYYELKTMLRCVKVCGQLSDVFLKELKRELKSLVRVLNTSISTPGKFPLVSRSNTENIVSLQHYHTQMFLTELGNSSESARFNMKHMILQNSSYYLFVRHFHYVVKQHASLSLLGKVISHEDWEAQFQFVISFIQVVVLPQFEYLVKLFPNCSEILEFCTKLKVNYERAIAGEPISDWKLEPSQEEQL